MMSEKSASYYARYLRNVALAEKMDNEFPDHEGWTSVIRFYAAVHLMNAYLVDKKGIDPKKLSAAAFGEFRPVAANDTKENKRQNRRAVIVVLPPESSIVMEKK